MYKLYLPSGYKNISEINVGKTGMVIGKGHSLDVVMRLTSNLLKEGRTLFTS